MAKELSGPQWTERFPTCTKIQDLAQPFQSCLGRFLAALQTAGATVNISATRRPAERAYLMHYAFQIARGANPSEVPAHPDVAIEWVHQNAKDSLEAARQMVAAYGIVFPPALQSRHEQGNAIDMSICWERPITIADAFGKTVTLNFPRSGCNQQLWPVGSSYGVMKNARDVPHWSIDGH